MRVKKQSGGKRIKQSGKSLIWVTVDDAQKQRIRIAAAMAGVPMSQFILQAGLNAVDKLVPIKRSSKTSRK